MRGRSTDNYMQDYLRAGSSDTPQDELVSLGTHANRRVRARVAENPLTPTATLRMLAVDTDVDVRVAVATNPNTPRSIVWQIANSNCVMTRLALAEHTDTPVSVLDKLTCDENPYVANEASKTLLAIESSPKFTVSPMRKDNVKNFDQNIDSMVS